MFYVKEPCVPPWLWKRAPLTEIVGWWNMIRWSQVGRLAGNMKSWCFDPRRQTSRHFYYDMTGSWELRGCKYQINILFYINSCLDVTLCWNNTCHKIENNSIQKLAWNFSTIRYNQIDPHNMTQLELQTIHRFSRSKWRPFPFLDESAYLKTLLRHYAKKAPNHDI